MLLLIGPFGPLGKKVLEKTNPRANKSRKKEIKERKAPWQHFKQDKNVQRPRRCYVGGGKKTSFHDKLRQTYTY